METLISDLIYFDATWNSKETVENVTSTLIIFFFQIFHVDEGLKVNVPRYSLLGLISYMSLDGMKDMQPVKSV